MPNINQLIAFENGELDFEQCIEFLQDGIDKGWVWKLQGFYGRAARHAIEAGWCHE